MVVEEEPVGKRQLPRRPRPRGKDRIQKEVGAVEPNRLWRKLAMDRER